MSLYDSTKLIGDVVAVKTITIVKFITTTTNNNNIIIIILAEKDSTRR